MLRPFNVQGRLFSCRIEREKFYPGLRLEPISLALRDRALATELSSTSTASL